MTAYSAAEAIEVAMCDAERVREHVPEPQLRQRIGRALKAGAANECLYCVRVGVSGGPGHAPSPRCRSGRRPHCTCDTCF